jgi:hypothetical protein
MKPGRGRRREIVQAVVTAGAVLAVTGGVIVAIAVSHGASSSSGGAAASTTSSTLSAPQLHQRDMAASWSDQATRAFGGTDLETSVSTMVNDQSDFQAGKLSAGDFTQRLAPVLAAFITGRDKVMALPPFPLSGLVKDMYVRAGELYVEAARLLQVEAALPAGSLRDQLGLSSRRTRELGDRVFDRGHVIIDAYLREPVSPDVEVRLPEEVPQWAAEGLAAGPPLEPVPPPPAAPLPPQRQATRPTEIRSKWLRTVHDTVTPSAPDIAAAIAAPDPPRLQRLADDLQAAADRLAAEPDPKGPEGREESARYRLAMLIRQESIRAAQLLTLAPAQAPALGLSAQRLQVIADGVVPADLGLASSGLDPSVLL